MTDNEIIKALECCGWSKNAKCKDCPFHSNYTAQCTTNLATDALDLINRQNEEIKRLLRAIEDKHCVYEKRVVTEAIKEFWEKAKQTIEFRTQPYVYITDGDNLVKEMVGDAE